MTMVVLTAEEIQGALGMRDGGGGWASSNLEASGRPAEELMSMLNAERRVDGQVKQKSISGRRNIFS